MLTYRMYAGDDTSNALFNKIRERFEFTGIDAYFIMNGSHPMCVQWDGQAPAEYVGATLEETAANHCAALNAAMAQTEPDPAMMEQSLNHLGVKTREDIDGTN